MDALVRRDKTVVEPLLKRTRYVPPYRTFADETTSSQLIYYLSQGEPAYDNLVRLQDFLKRSGYDAEFAGQNTLAPHSGEVTTILRFNEAADAGKFESDYGYLLTIEPSLQNISATAAAAGEGLPSLLRTAIYEPRRAYIPVSVPRPSESGPEWHHTAAPFTTVEFPAVYCPGDNKALLEELVRKGYPCYLTNNGRIGLGNLDDEQTMKVTAQRLINDHGPYINLGDPFHNSLRRIEKSRQLAGHVVH